MELIKLTNTDTGEVFECRPYTEFVMPTGTFKVWNEARLFEDGKDDVFLKAGQVIEMSKPKRTRRTREEMEEEEND